jgi:phosphoglycerate dehydrogenase-like enzyme
MTKPVITYTDPPWAVGPDGRVDPGLATIERQVYGGEVELRFAPTTGGRYVQEGEGFLDAVRGADALAIYRCRVTRELLDAVGSGLKAVGRQGVGFDNLNPELLKAAGIIGFNIPDYCMDEVATHTLALLLALERRILPQHQTLTGGRFDIYAGGMPRRLRELTAGIIGFGRIGRVVATRLRLFYGRVLACDPYVSADPMEAYGVEKVGFEDLLAQSDAVLLHCVLDGETQGMMDTAAFARMKRGAYLINAARGALVEARALYEALAEGRLGGAGIDVFSPEDPHRDEWYGRVVKLPNVVVTSHRAYLSQASEISQRRRTAEALLELLRTGRPPAVGHLTEGVQISWTPPLHATAGARAR